MTEANYKEFNSRQTVPGPDMKYELLAYEAVMPTTLP
jgi:hypothetical protein